MMNLPKLAAGLLILCQITVLDATAAHVEQAQGHSAAKPAGRLVAQSLFAIEQLDADFITLGDAEVQQRPTADSERLTELAPDSRVQVTGQVTGQNWYRVITDDGDVGYVDGRSIRPLAAESEAPAAPEGRQSAAVTVPRPLLTPPAAGRAGRPGEAFQDCAQCPEMVRLPSGRFIMGSEGGDATEQPLSEVAIGYGFALGKYEVTVAEWMACVSAGACSHEPKPVEDPKRTALRNVSWDDAQQYLGWLSRVTGKAYRLPSEGEWEYAMRGNTGSAYSWGDRMEVGRADCRNCGGAWDRKAPATVGNFAANSFGLHDMSGGVAEWTADCWFKDHRNRPGDGTARNKRGCQQRVLRGGSWRDEASYLRAASRLYYDASVQYVVNGFRVALTLE